MSGLGEADRTAIDAWWNSDWPSDYVVDVLDLLAETVEAIVARHVEAFRAEAVAAIEVTARVCSSAHGEQCIGGISYRDAAHIIRDLPTDAPPRPRSPA